MFQRVGPVVRGYRTLDASVEHVGQDAGLRTGEQRGASGLAPAGQRPTDHTEQHVRAPFRDCATLSLVYAVADEPAGVGTRRRRRRRRRRDVHDQFVGRGVAPSADEFLAGRPQPVEQLPSQPPFCTRCHTAFRKLFKVSNSYFYHQHAFCKFFVR